MVIESDPRRQPGPGRPGARSAPAFGRGDRGRRADPVELERHPAGDRPRRRRSTLAIYKPQRGERPLWDFPSGTLGRREVATYLVAEAVGWGLVPPTVLREGPYGSGSVQLFVEAQEEIHFFTIQDDARYADDLRRLAALDVICNNADRKAGHCLVDVDGRLWAIDNALTFHVDPKLRTVIWDFAGTPLPARIGSDLRAAARPAGRARARAGPGAGGPVERRRGRRPDPARPGPSRRHALPRAGPGACRPLAARLTNQGP